MTLTTLRLAYSITIGAIAFAVAFLLGTPINLALGPAMGGIINAVVTAMIVAIGCRGVERFPYAVVVWLAFAIPSIFTPTMGPPGPHKLVIALVTGLTMELVFWIAGRKAWAYALVGGIMSDVMTLGILAAMIVLSLNPEGASALLSRIWMLLPLYFVLGSLGMYLGYQVFDRRIRTINFVQRIQATPFENPGV
jgi:hypothetical protein